MRGMNTAGRADDQAVGQKMKQIETGLGWGKAPRRLITALLLGGSVLGGMLPLAMPQPAQAQNLFAPRLYVNGTVITEYEVQQRARFYELLRQPGDPEEAAVKALIDERVQMDTGKRLGIKPTQDEILKGMEEFASRANLTAEQLVGELQKAGVSPETFRDFVTAGLVWRQMVRAKFLGKVPVSEADVDKALEKAARPRALKVLVSELVIPAEPGKEAEALALARRLSETVRGEGAFAAAAREYSAAPTGQNGGRVPEWLSLSTLPSAISQEILGLEAGDVSGPVVVPNAVVLFQLRQIAMDETAEPISVKVEWAEYLVPDDAETIAQVRNSVDECNDLYGLAKGQEGVLTVQNSTAAAVPGDVGLELAKLDAGEISAALTRGGLRRLIMLCSRTPVMEAEPDRNRIKEQVINEKLDGMANGYLEELRSAAIIRQP